MHPVDVANAAQLNAIGIVEFTPSTGQGTVKKIPTRGHPHWTLTSVKPDASTATVKLKGTNNPNPADANGEDLITNTHLGNDQKDGSAASKAWKYVFVDVTAIAGGVISASAIRVHGSGQGTQ